MCSPFPVELPEKDQGSVVCAGIGAHHMIIAAGNKTYAAGINTHGQLGLGKDKASVRCDTAVEIPGLNGMKIVQICCSRYSTAVLTASGCVYTFGSSLHGKLGHPLSVEKKVKGINRPDQDHPIFQPTRVSKLGEKPIRNIAMGETMTVC